MSVNREDDPGGGNGLPNQWHGDIRSRTIANRSEIAGDFISNTYANFGNYIYYHHEASHNHSKGMESTLRGAELWRPIQDWLATQTEDVRGYITALLRSQYANAAPAGDGTLLPQSTSRRYLAVITPNDVSVEEIVGLFPVRSNSGPLRMADLPVIRPHTERFIPNLYGFITFDFSDDAADRAQESRRAQAQITWLEDGKKEYLQKEAARIQAARDQARRDRHARLKRRVARGLEAADWGLAIPAVRYIAGFVAMTLLISGFMLATQGSVTLQDWLLALLIVPLGVLLLVLTGRAALATKTPSNDDIDTSGSNTPLPPDGGNDSG